MSSEANRHLPVPNGIMPALPCQKWEFRAELYGVAGTDGMPGAGPERRVQRLTTSVAIGEERTWLDLPLLPPGRK
jgi:hypothetical protein